MRTGLSAKISIIGAGAWGTAIARVIADKGYDVDIWCYEKEIADDILDQIDSEFHEAYRKAKKAPDAD